MTGFESKRSAAQNKVNDEADTLTIVYQRGFADGKKAAQRKPLDDWDIDAIRHNIGVDIDSLWARKFARAIEQAHNIKEGT